MGLSGPPPKPTALKRAEGNPGKRRLNDFEPQPLEIAPRCPPHLDELARQEWKRIVPILPGQLVKMRRAPRSDLKRLRFKIVQPTFAGIAFRSLQSGWLRGWS